MLNETEKPAERNYTISDGELLQKADEIIMFRERDAAEFADQGIDDTEALEDARAALDALPTDDALLGTVTEMSDAKDAKRAAVEVSVAALRTAATRAHAGNPGAYRRYGFDGFSDLEDDNVYRKARSMAVVAGVHIALLTPKGFNATKLTAFTALAAEYDAALDAVVAAKAARDVATRTRVDAGNKLHDQLSEIAMVGRNIFLTTNEAKYNDYVLDPAGNGNNQPDPTPPGGAGD